MGQQSDAAYDRRVEADALIRWLRPDEGGRSEPPPVPELRATAILAEEPSAAGAAEHFSVIVTWNGEASADTAMPARVRTLIDDAFSEPGQRFVVMEGPTAVALGEIVSLI